MPRIALGLVLVIVVLLTASTVAESIAFACVPDDPGYPTIC